MVLQIRVLSAVFAGCLLGSVSALPEPDSAAALGADDECLALDAGADRDRCALSALQLRSVAKSQAEAETAQDRHAVLVDDECGLAPREDGECSLSVLQLRGVKAVEAAGPLALAGDGDNEPRLSHPTPEPGWGRSHWSSAGVLPDPIFRFDDHLDSALFTSMKGLYYQFTTQRGEKVLSGEVQSRVGGLADEKTPIALTSVSKLITSFAVMRTMQLRPDDWYPEKFVHEFPGWEDYRDFRIQATRRRANITILQLLTHTSGLPYNFLARREGLKVGFLWFTPGTGFGYTMGHRVLGWMLLDYWQPKTKSAKPRTLQDIYRHLVFEPLGMSSATRFLSGTESLMGWWGEAGDAAIASTGEDLTKLAVVALRRGTTPDGKELISQEFWNKWAVPNLLPGGKLSQDLVWWNVANADLGAKIMENPSGKWGFSLFAATYDDSKEVGWCGFFGTCLRVSYDRDLAFVMMQRDVADLKTSRKYLRHHFDEMAEFLQCRGAQMCAQAGRRCQVGSSVVAWSERCPHQVARPVYRLTGKVRTELEPDNHACYIPSNGGCSR